MESNIEIHKIDYSLLMDLRVGATRSGIFRNLLE